MQGNARISLVLFSVVVLAVVALPNAGTLGAQGGTCTLVAGVADAETGQPLEGAEVILFDAHRLARANALGEATIAELPRGTQHVRVRRLGYVPIEVDIAIARDTTGAVFRLRRSAVQLGVINVEADWSPPNMKDVEVRMRQGIGRFLTEAEIGHDRDRDFGSR
jgi:carboxypeptidase family protein